MTQGKSNKLRIAIECFQKQKYKKKELVIVHKKRDQKEVNANISNTRGNIRIFEVEDHLTLGEMRNISLMHAVGEYVCTWDDDDWHHPERLSLQIKFAKDNYKDGSILIKIILHNSIENKAYLSYSRPWDASLLVKKSALNQLAKCYPALNKREDVALTNALLKINVIYPIIRPELYVYNFTGENTWSRDHFDKMFSLSQRLPDDVEATIKKLNNVHFNLENIDLKMLLVSFNYFYEYIKKNDL